MPRSVRPLPSEAARLLRDLDAPPRLVAHLTLVHDVACQLLDAFPALEVDRQAVRLGAALHDVGKVRVPGELTGPGRAHEEAGRELLLAAGFDQELARFAVTHGGPTPGATVEDALVRLADAIWKGKRDERLEAEVVAMLSRSGAPAWEVYAALDDILTAIAAAADERLAWHAAHPPG